SARQRDLVCAGSPAGARHAHPVDRKQVEMIGCGHRNPGYDGQTPRFAAPNINRYSCAAHSSCAHLPRSSVASLAHFNLIPVLESTRQACPCGCGGDRRRDRKVCATVSADRPHRDSDGGAGEANPRKGCACHPVTKPRIEEGLTAIVAETRIEKRFCQEDGP